MAVCVEINLRMAGEYLHQHQFIYDVVVIELIVMEIKINTQLLKYRVIFDILLYIIL